MVLVLFGTCAKDDAAATVVVYFQRVTVFSDSEVSRDGEFCEKSADFRGSDR